MAAIDPFQATSDLPSAPPRQAQAIDLASTDFEPTKVTKCVLVGVAGDVVVIMAGDNSQVTLKLPAGIHWLQIKKFIKTGTAATNLVALF